MKFLITYQAAPDAPPPTPEKLAAIGEFTEKAMKTGKVVMTGGLVRPSRGLHLRCEKGKISQTDGPYAETKELIDGFVLVKAASRQEAVGMATDFMGVAGDGTAEILQVFDIADGPPR